ncbi:MAG TPA: hypothetical protein VFC55_02215, partial [Desulfobaccales bacterium]|nr:hypothetical protein [Desulfobaccales bacterium]
QTQTRQKRLRFYAGLVLTGCYRECFNYLYGSSRLALELGAHHLAGSKIRLTSEWGQPPNKGKREIMG